MGYPEACYVDLEQFTTPTPPDGLNKGFGPNSNKYNLKDMECIAVETSWMWDLC